MILPVMSNWWDSGGKLNGSPFRVFLPSYAKQKVGFIGRQEERKRDLPQWLRT
jgi:hypothetical protein